MNIQYAFEHINQKVFKTIYIENISIKEATSIKNTYPYFTFIRYILAYKEKEIFQNITLEAALQRDPLWFGYVLEHMNKKSEIPNTNFSTTTSIYHTHTPTIDNEKIVLPMLDISLSTHIQDIPKPLAKNNEIEIPIVDETIVLPTIDTQAILSHDDDNLISEQENSIEIAVVDDVSEVVIPRTNTEITVKEDNLSIDETVIVTPDKTNSAFIPLHVEDYFSALNINLPKEKMSHTNPLPPTTTSSKQKPFIDWLEEFSHSYKKVNSMISSEKNDTPVASETMAEIWIAEKRYDKAILTYEKLSLLFPEKSVYFANKISELKNTLK